MGEPQIETTDLFRGAYLLCQGCQVATTRVVGPRNVVFVFEGDRVREEDLRYRMGKATVNPVALRETLNYLRDEVSSCTRRQGTRSMERTHRRGTSHDRHSKSRAV